MAHFEFPCLVFKQRESNDSPTFAVFSAPAAEIRKWAAIRRRTEYPEGPQRKLSQAKIGAISRFFQKDPRNTIPTAVTVTLNVAAATWSDVNPGSPGDVSVKRLSFDVPDDVTEAAKPGLVIDGQHRLLGMDKFDHNCRMCVVALLDVDNTETAFQFLVINQKAAKVPSDHIRTLVLDYKEDELAQRLRTARVTLHENLKYVGIINWDEASPFHGHIALVSEQGDEEERFVQPAAIEQCIAVIQSKKVRELDGDDALCEFFYAIWSPIQKKWTDLWNKDSKLMTKVGIISMTTHMTEALVAKYDWGELDVSDPDAVRGGAEQVLQFQTPEFWRCAWTLPISDTKAVRDTIIQSLTQIARNLRSGQPWHEEIDIVIF